MKILLATGIYPPVIGGPATYVRALAAELSAAGEDVEVLTYGNDADALNGERWSVRRVSLRGGPFLRWWRYARALRELGKDADIVYAFSLVSVGVPLLLARLRHPKTLLRLGGDFGWERYTDRGGKLSLRGWYESHPPSRWLMAPLLRQFDQLVFSTQFQTDLYERFYPTLPAHSVIENAFAPAEPQRHIRIGQHLRVLGLSRFVRFKNLEGLVRAMEHVPEATLTLVGDGPRKPALKHLVEKLGLDERVLLVSPVHDEDHAAVLDQHDVLVVPSFTEISPNAALEARQAGLPVLLTAQTGLSSALTSGMLLRSLRTPTEIASAIRELDERYDEWAEEAARPLEGRAWSVVTEEHRALFASLLS